MEYYDTLIASGERLLIAVYTLQASEHLPKATGVCLFEDGLLCAMDDAPRVYTLAWEESTEGVHSEPCLGLLQQASLSPWELKRAFTDQLDDPDASVSAEWSNVNDDLCVHLVNNSLKRLNEGKRVCTAEPH